MKMRSTSAVLTEPNQLPSTRALLWIHRATMVLFFAITLVGCGGTDGSVASQPNDTRSPINRVALTNNLLTTETRMPVYSKVGQRVALLDPIHSTETWGASATGFEFGVALHDVSGVALFGSTNLRVATPSATLNFALKNRYYHVAAAAKHTSFALASAESSQVEIVHSLGAGLWQHAQINLPWIAGPTASVNELLLFFDEQATKLVAFSMIDGRYAVFRAAGSDAQFMTTATFCEGTTKPADADYLFTAATWVESATAVVAVDRFGSAHSFAINQACVDYSTRPSLPLGLVAGRHVSALVVTETNSIWALVEGGDVLRVSQNEGGVAGVEALLPSVCANPISAMSLPENRILVVCAVTRARGSAVSAYLHVNSVELSYFTYDATSKRVLSSFSFLREETAGSGVFPEQMKLYRATESSLGELEIYSLLTGERSRVTGLYVRGLLDSL